MPKIAVHWRAAMACFLSSVLIVGTAASASATASTPPTPDPASAVARASTPEQAATPSPEETPQPALTAQTASAPDITGPTFISGTVDKNTFNLADGPATFTVTVKASDPSGVDTPLITVGNSTGQSAGFGQMTLASGTSANGTWKRTVTIPTNAAPGTWTVTLYPLSDTLGNDGPGFQTIATITITNKKPTDVTGPTFISGTVDKNTFNLADGPATFTVTVKASDPSGVDTPLITVGNSTGQSAGFGQMTLASGTSANGTWKRTVTIPTNAAPGTWTVTLYPLSDTLGNDGPGFQTIATITITNKKPVLVAGSVAITGTPQVGAAMTATTKSWPTGAKLAYSWRAEGVSIPGATGKTFVPTATQVGKRLTVSVIGTLTGFTSSSKTSDATSAVVARTLLSPAPSVTGTAKVGSTLTAQPNVWTKGTTLTYQWFADSKAISGATKATFKVTSAQVAQRLSVRVTGKLSGYTSATKESSKTAAVAK